MYCQNDPRWKDILLGKGEKTIGEVGCLLTCFAQLLTNYGHYYTPAELNQEFYKRGAFINGNELPDDALESWSDIIWLPSIYSPQLKDFSVNPGEEIIIRLRSPKHFLIFKWLEGSQVIVADPLSGNVVNFASRYGSPWNNIYRLIRYNFDAELVNAIRAFQRAGIITNPSLWLENARPGKTITGENVRSLILKTAPKLLNS